MTVQELIEKYTADVNAFNAKLKDIRKDIKDAITSENMMILKDYYEDRAIVVALKVQVLKTIEDLKKLIN